MAPTPLVLPLLLEGFDTAMAPTAQPERVDGGGVPMAVFSLRGIDG